MIPIKSQQTIRYVLSDQDQHIDTDLSQVIGNLQLAAMLLGLSLDDQIRLVDDRQKHVEQDEEDEEEIWMDDEEESE